MIQAQYEDRKIVADILTKSFDDNNSVNYIIPQDSKRAERIQRLMYYSFDLCYQFGEIFLTADKSGCALALFPERKKTTIKTAWMDLNLVISAIGFPNLKKALDRESKVRKLQPQGAIYHLWYIGVDPGAQHKGLGTKLMEKVLESAALNKRQVCLETSTLKNIHWYEKFGFKIYQELDLGYRLYFMKYDGR